MTTPERVAGYVGYRPIYTGGGCTGPEGADEVELLKCGCTGNGCEDITIEYPGAGFIVRNAGTHRVRVSLQILSGWDCGRWTHFKLHPGESKQYLSGGYCCPYEAEHY